MVKALVIHLLWARGKARFKAVTKELVPALNNVALRAGTVAHMFLWEPATVKI